MRIAVDAMGGDQAPEVVVQGAVAAACQEPIRLLLVGPRPVVEAEVARYPEAAQLPIEIIDAPDVVAMDEPFSAIARRQRRTSVRVAADLVGRGVADALFTAGHSGAAILAAHGSLGRLPGADRPALAATIPTVVGAAILLDAGATVECRPVHLLQFAHLGAAYASVALGVARPRVALLSNGQEAGKGNELIREAYRLLEASSLTFVGPVEATDLFVGDADVVVCDGFTGNVALKTSEGLVEAIEHLLADEIAKTVTAQVGALLTRGAFRRFRARLDYSEYGGAPLLGVEGLCVIGHGRSSARAIERGVALTARFARERLVERLRQVLAATPRAVLHS
jgi:glycerol-3-phosphate acyltransferase PlsX